MARYSKSSPYAETKVVDDVYLDVLNIRPVPALSSDVLYEIESQYHHRPDLLAYDLYDDPKLWWVFAHRNMDVIVDPIYDFESGVSIYIPTGPALKNLLGL